MAMFSFDRRTASLFAAPVVPRVAADLRGSFEMVAGAWHQPGDAGALPLR
jgi:hypothetical protein